MILVMKVDETKKCFRLASGSRRVGCPALQYLTVAGVGRIEIDDDIVEESNLQRQVVYRLEDVGSPKQSPLNAWSSITQTF